MNVRNCRKCGNLFNYVSGPPICMACREKLEEKFQEVKKYIQDNGHAGIQQVAEACDVSTNQIHQWLREERLELSAESGVTLSCENCGAAILSGRFCQKCKTPWLTSWAPASRNRNRPRFRRKRTRRKIRRCVS